LAARALIGVLVLVAAALGVTAWVLRSSPAAPVSSLEVQPPAKLAPAEPAADPVPVVVTTPREEAAASRVPLGHVPALVLDNVLACTDLWIHKSYESLRADVAAQYRADDEAVRRSAALQLRILRARRQDAGNPLALARATELYSAGNDYCRLALGKPAPFDGFFEQRAQAVATRLREAASIWGRQAIQAEPDAAERAVIGRRSHPEWFAPREPKRDEADRRARQAKALAALKPHDETVLYDEAYKGILEQSIAQRAQLYNSLEGPLFELPDNGSAGGPRSVYLPQATQPRPSPRRSPP
jgi:hypothetical protein